MTALGDNLNRSGSLPPPFIVPQGEEPVTPDSKSGRSSSLLERVSAPPLSLRTGDTVSEHSTVCTSDDAKYACTYADATSQPPTCSNLECSLGAEPAPWKDVRTTNMQQEQVKKRKVSLEEASSVHKFEPRCEQSKPKDNQSGLSLQIATTDMQRAQHALLNEADKSESKDCEQPLVAQKVAHATITCTDQHTCDADSGIVKSAVAGPKACEAAGPLPPSENSVCGVPAVRRPTKGVVVPNNSNLIAAIRHRRARTSEQSSASVCATLPPPRPGTGAVQQTGDVPPPPKFLASPSAQSLAPRSEGLNSAALQLPDPQPGTSHGYQSLPIRPPSTWAAHSTHGEENDAGGFLRTAGSSQGIRSNYSLAASHGSFLNKPNSAVQQAKPTRSTPPAKGSILGTQQDAPQLIPSGARPQLMVGPDWANAPQMSVSGWTGSGPMQHGMSSSLMGPSVNSSAQSMHRSTPAGPAIRPNPMQQHSPPCPPPGSLAYAQAQRWHDAHHSGHQQSQMAAQGHMLPPNQQNTYPGGPGAHHRWPGDPGQHFPHPPNQPYHAMPPQMPHPFQACPQSHSMAMQQWHPARPPFGSQMGMGSMNHAMPEQNLGMNQCLMGGPWGGRSLV